MRYCRRSGRDFALRLVAHDGLAIEIQCRSSEVPTFELMESANSPAIVTIMKILIS